MGKILCITSGLTGIVNASLELMDRLQRAGHEVICAAPRDIGQQLAKFQISFSQLPEIADDPAPAIPDIKGPFRKISRLIYKYKNAKQRRAEALENIEPRAFDKLLKNTNPDLVLLDVELHEYIFKTYARQYPLILLSQWFSLWNRPGLPYLLHDTIPGEGFSGQPLAIRFSWWKIRRKRAWTFLRKKWLSGGTDRRSILLTLAKQEGFPLAYLRENYWPGPFTYDQLPVMSMTAEELEFPHDPRPELHYIGAMVFGPREHEADASPEAQRLQTVLDKHLKDDCSLIYCSVSTLSAGDLDFIQKLIAAVTPQKDWRLIIGMGGKIAPETLGNLPENIFAFASVNQLKVLAQADCSINHGGIHSINECLYYQVPMLIYSGKRSDQNGCAARVAYHQLGIMADKDLDNSLAIQKNIQKVLADKIYTTNLANLNQKLTKYKKEAKLERLISERMRSRPASKKQANA